MRKCKNTLCSKDNVLTPPPLGRKHSWMSFWSILCSFSISAYFPLESPLNKVWITLGFQELVYFKSHWKAPSTSLLQALPITSSVMMTGIPIIHERISVLVNSFNPISVLDLPSRLGCWNKMCLTINLKEF